MTDASIDIIGGLPAISWRGIQFPISELRTRIEQEVVEHARPDQDGARLEGTGRKPIVVSGKAIFRQGTRAGQSESFSGLYPDGHRAFLKACADRSTGPLMHPTLGMMRAKVLHAETMLMATKRDGEDVDVEWKEDIEETGTGELLRGPSPLQDANASATSLDGALGLKNPPPPGAIDGTLSISDALFALKGLIDTSSLLSKQVGGAIDHILYRLDSIQDSVERAGDVQDWPITNACERIRSSLFALKTTAASTAREVNIYITPVPMTLGAVANNIGASIADLISLNPSLGALPRIPERTIVRRYA